MHAVEESKRTWYEIIETARVFWDGLPARKREAGPQISWYPYATLSQLATAGGLLNTIDLPFRALAGDGPILDIGCGDGDLSFLLEQCGYDVIGLDHPRTNQSGMRGVRTLHAHLGSRVEILEKDLDRPFEGPQPKGQFAFLLGVLYHLENPLQVMRWLSHQAEYCLLSTRVARFGPKGEPLEPVEVAYLTYPSELNQDDSNFWIFTPAGLRRLLQRSGWSLLALSLDGSTASRSANGEEFDERAYCLLKTTRSLRNVETAYGWTEDDGQGWRWTHPRFAAWLRPPQLVRSAQLDLRIFVPEEHFVLTGPITIEATIAGRSLGSQTFSSTGDWSYRAEITDLPADGSSIFVEFAVTPPLQAPPPDRRELGVIVASLGLS